MTPGPILTRARDALGVDPREVQGSTKGALKNMYAALWGTPPPTSWAKSKIIHSIRLAKRGLGKTTLTAKLHRGLTKLVGSDWVPGETRFRGNALTEYLGILYLLMRHTRDCSPVLELMLGWDDEKFADDRNVAFADFEVTYSRNGRVLFPPLFAETFKECVKKGARFVFLMLDVPGHSNCMVYDTGRRSLERFDPYGGKLVSSGGLAPRVNDRTIEKAMREQGVVIKTYLKPMDYMAKGVQEVEEVDEDVERTRMQGDPRGFCAAWSLWYLHTLLETADVFPPSIPAAEARRRVLEMGHAALRERGESYRDFIRGFSVFLSTHINKLKAIPPGRSRAGYIHQLRRRANGGGGSSHRKTTTTR